MLSMHDLLYDLMISICIGCNFLPEWTLPFYFNSASMPFHSENSVYNGILIHVLLFYFIPVQFLLLGKNETSWSTPLIVKKKF